MPVSGNQEIMVFVKRARPTRLLLQFFAICTSVVLAQNTIFQSFGAPFKSPVTTAPGFSAHVLFSNATLPRGIAFDTESNLLVIERGLGVTSLSALRESSGVTLGWERSVIVNNPGVTHGIEIDESSLYISTAGEVLVYKYDPQTRTVASSVPITLIRGLPADGELTTHTLLLERDTLERVVALLVGSGPLTNIDPTARDPSSGRSEVRRFPLPSVSGSETPIEWSSGRVIAYGIRNPGGFAFLPSSELVETPTFAQQLYIVENGASIDNVTGLTPEFVNDNPADEINIVPMLCDGTGLPPFFGFPDCATLWNPLADPEGVTQYKNLSKGDQISLKLESERDDAWCQDTSNNIPPALSFQAHSVPLDVKFYRPPDLVSTGSFPSGFSGDAFVSFHGSFDRTPPTGYGIVRVDIPIASPSQEARFIIQATDLGTCPGSCIRPVGIAFGKDGRLYASSDSSGEIFVIETM
ncbi:hypothetical protein AMATHDRAFT_60193 [Amanita thiersii Skay4041]|uniref:Pyrroloquinoline quinone-dependent pyranose dehydrogenase beta-propeller domain-containing protein n=1 Tax=Amanita thiersii Skay4041 TaxID=703135 RepID=A0A2A9NRN4_9AGAR|nr:hypothetical protein AMATHDRAFT_60193 [Amanita thiersii Skay4041]